MFLFAAICSLALVSCDSSTSGDGEYPNIIIILADDLGYGDVGAYGAKLVNTPHIDRLAQEGRTFTDAHSPSSVCSPTRYGLLTGRYAWRGRLKSGVLQPSSPLLIEEGRETIASFLQDQGYTTACVGKWHLGFQEEYPTDWNAPLSPGPLEVGFDYYFGVPTSPNLPPFVYVEDYEVVDRKPGEIIEVVDGVEISGIDDFRRANEIGRRTTDKAVEFISENKDDPFFLYFATSSVHFPITPDDEFVGTSAAGPYGDFVHEFDWSVGQILEALDANDLSENTLIIVTSDNGAWPGFSCGLGHDPNGDLAGNKGTLAEGGHRVPFVARWPSVIPANSQSDDLVSLVDIFSTIASMLNVRVPTGAAVDSIDREYAFSEDFPDVFRPENQVTVHHSWRGKFAIRFNEWKYNPEQFPLEFTESARTVEELQAEAGCVIDDDTLLSPEQLFNIIEDPQETNNLINVYPGVGQLMAIALQKRIDQPERDPH